MRWVGLAVLGLLSGVAQAGTLYVVRTSDDTLMSFDTRARTFTAIGRLNASFDWGALAWDPTTSTMYMIAGRGDPSLYTVDLNTGNATLVGRHNLTDLFAMAIDPDSGDIYGLQGTFAQGLYRLDRRNASPTYIGDPGRPMSGAEWDPQGRGIISNNSFTSDFYLVDATNGAATLLGNGGVSPSDMGLAYDEDTDLFWGFDVAQSVFSFDPNNGYRGTRVMSSGFPMDGAAGTYDANPSAQMDLINVTGFCPGTETFRAIGATPGGQVAFLYSQRLGDGTIPGGPCGGRRVPIVNPQLITRVRADVNGEAEFTGSPGLAQCSVVKLMALDLSSCAQSNLQTP